MVNTHPSTAFQLFQSEWSNHIVFSGVNIAVATTGATFAASTTPAESSTTARSADDRVGLLTTSAPQSLTSI